MKWLLLSFILLLTVTSGAQEPIKFAYSVTKTADQQFEIHIHASIAKGWHLFSSVQPTDAIAEPTKIVFVNNPLNKQVGRLIEIGKKIEYRNKTLGILQYQYEDSVEFVQKFEKKSKVKTNISGTITYQACTNEKCLTPQTIKFNIDLE